MLIKGDRVTGRDVEKTLIRHLLDGTENDDVRILAGGEDHILRCVEAAAAGKKSQYAVRHFIIAPEEKITDEQAFGIVRDLAKEFGFDPDNISFLAHTKDRLVIGSIPHFHLIVPEYDADNSTRILDSKHSFARHEKISRISEEKLGHRLISGAHNVAVANRLEEEGAADLAARVRALEPARDMDAPDTSYSAADAAPLARAGLIPSRTIADIRAAFLISEGPDAFQQHLAKLGLRVSPGTRRRKTLCVWSDDKCFNALDHYIPELTREAARAFFSTTTKPEKPKPPEPIGNPDDELLDDPEPRLTVEEIRAIFQVEKREREPQPLPDIDLRLKRGHAKDTAKARDQAKDKLAKRERELEAAKAAEKKVWFFARWFRLKSYRMAAQDVADKEKTTAEAKLNLTRKESDEKENRASFIDATNRYNRRAHTRRQEYERQCEILTDLQEKVLRMNVVIRGADELRRLIKEVLAGNDPLDPDNLIFRPGYKL